MCEKYIRSTGRNDFDEPFFDSATAILKQFTVEKDLQNAVTKDQIRETLPEKINQFRLQNADFCRKIDLL